MHDHEPMGGVEYAMLLTSYFASSKSCASANLNFPCALMACPISRTFCAICATESMHWAYMTRTEASGSLDMYQMFGMMYSGKMAELDGVIVEMSISCTES